LTFTNAGPDIAPRRRNFMPIFGSEELDNQYFSVQREEKGGGLIPLVDNNEKYTPRIADLTNRDAELLARERALIRILPREIAKDDDEYNMKLSYYAGSSIPIETLRAEFERIKPAIKRIARINRYTAAANNDNDNKLSLCKQIEILDWEV